MVQPERNLDAAFFKTDSANEPVRDWLLTLPKSERKIIGSDILKDPMKNKHIGSFLDDYLQEQGILEDCRAAAIKFKLAHELEKAMLARNITKAQIARQLKTSRTGVDRLLDPQNTSITLNTMAKVAQLLGKRIEFSLR